MARQCLLLTAFTVRPTLLPNGLSLEVLKLVLSPHTSALSPAEVEEFQQRGFLGPIHLLSAAERQDLRRALRSAPAPETWQKGQAATSSAYFEIASNPALVERIAALIGPDVMLWGASLIKRKPGQLHPWHTDIETSAHADGTVTVWIGLKNTDIHSSLDLVARSHRFGMSVQQRAMEANHDRAATTTEEVLEWAKEFDPLSDIVRAGATDGDAIIFDGRLWHGSHNTSPDDTRTALLLQYARPDRPIFIPDLKKLDYPFRSHEEPRPPCVLVRGEATKSQNRIVAPPTEELAATSPGWVKFLNLPLGEDAATGWRRHRLFRGATPAIADFESHASVLSAGKKPHEPHEHVEDELLVMLDGEAEITIEDGAGRQTIPVRRGDFAYYPTGQQRHTLQASTAGPAYYLMFKWSGSERVSGKDHLPISLNHMAAIAANFGPDREDGFTTQAVFNGASRYLRQLKCHVTRLLPGAGYEPHSDSYDVAMVILEGEVETLDETCGPNTVIFYPANQPHGIRNTGATTAVYIVFEFHA